MAAWSPSRGSSAEEAEALVARALPAQHEGALTASHVNTVEEIRWYVATVSMPPPEQSWCTAVLGVDPTEVRAFLEQDFEPEQIGEIELLMPPDEDVPLETTLKVRASRG
jgi:hypothetical protein